MLSDTFSEGKLKDLRGLFPLDQPTELDDHSFLNDNDLEDVDDDAQPTIKIPETTSENRGPPFKSPVLGSGFTSPFSLQVSRLGSMDPGTHLGKVVVLRDISFVT